MKNNREKIKTEFTFYLTNVARSARRTSDGFNLGRTAVGSFLSFIEVDKLFDYAPEKWSHIESMYDITDPIEAKQIADSLLNDEAFLQHDSVNNQGWRSGAISHYVCFINARFFFSQKQDEITLPEKLGTLNQPLQQIFYGAPGTGKSNIIKREVDDLNRTNYRVTFHPDSDYSTFVGSYKPTKVKTQKQPRMDMSLDDLARELGRYYNNEELGKIGGLQRFCFEYYPYIDGEYMSVSVTKLIELAGVPKDYNVEVNKYIKFIHLFPNLDSDKITYEFVPQAFTKAYTTAWNTTEDVYLIIEEINRGNCAQIFGDLFQLLDRKNGISEYPVDADSDLADHIRKELSKSQRTDFPEGVKEGKKLVLPKNLYIWATMNTSDQSLFPIDSAFKRRWDWTYMKIKNHPEENYKIKLSDTEYDWWEFIQRINEIIASMTSSADKQLGYFFCKAAADGTISPETFVSKVIFYLWNDVFKDYGFEDASLFRYKNDKEEMKDLTFPDFYDEAGEKVNETRLKDFLEKVLNWKKEDNNNNER